MRECKNQYNNKIVYRERKLKTHFCYILCLYLFLPSSALAFLEGSRSGEKIYLSILFVSVIWAGYISMSVIIDKDPLLKTVLILVGLIVINIIIMFTTIVGFLYSMITIPILIVVLFWIYYEL